MHAIRLKRKCVLSHQIRIRVDTQHVSEIRTDFVVSCQNALSDHNSHDYPIFVCTLYYKARTNYVFIYAENFY